MLEMLLIVIPVESAVVRNRDVKAPVRSVQEIRGCSWVGGDLPEVVRGLFRVRRGHP